MHKSLIFFAIRHSCTLIKEPRWDPHGLQMCWLRIIYSLEILFIFSLAQRLSNSILIWEVWLHILVLSISYFFMHVNNWMLIYATTLSSYRWSLPCLWHTFTLHFQELEKLKVYHQHEHANLQKELKQVESCLKEKQLELDVLRECIEEDEEAFTARINEVGILLILMLTRHVFHWLTPATLIDYLRVICCGCMISCLWLMLLHSFRLTTPAVALVIGEQEFVSSYFVFINLYIYIVILLHLKQTFMVF